MDMALRVGAPLIGLNDSGGKFCSCRYSHGLLYNATLTLR
jgi:hypothetical protein